ncbi:MAG: PH domain-containing protein [Candidatus Sericytochromatia bacterium]
MSSKILLEIAGKRIRMGSVNKYLLIYDDKIEVYNNHKKPESLSLLVKYDQIAKIDAREGLYCGSLIIKTKNNKKIVMQNIAKEDGLKAIDTILEIINKSK